MLLVAVYHVWVHRVSGGVDVFLMLSGFFVGGGLVRSFVRQQPVRLTDYVPRLGRRLLPALVVTLTAVLVASAALLPQSRWSDVSGETLASLTYLENWRLALAAQTYGAADASQSPLQHVWSLSVQGQLFVGLPLVLLAVWWLAGRLAPRRRVTLLLTTLAAATAASFVYAVAAVSQDQSFAYYDTFARAWEYLAGALLATLAPKVRLSRAWALVAGWAGASLILATGLVLDGGSLFPGPATLMPLLGAALVVVGGARPTGAAPVAGSVNRLLSWSPVARAGGYAYAFYLWHWPVLVFVIVLLDRPVGWVTGLGVLVISCVLAWGTKTWVEDPLREPVPSVPRRPARSRAPRGAVLVAAAVVVALPVGWFVQVEARRATFAAVGAADLDGFPGALAVAAPGSFRVAAGVPPIPHPVVAPSDGAMPSADGCVTFNDDTAVVTCTYGDTSSPLVVAVVGNSHAEQWVDALDEIGQRVGFRVDTFLKGGCPLSLDTPAENPWDACRDWNRSVLDEIAASPPDAVFTIGTRYAWNDDSIPGNEFVPEGYRRAWEALGRADVPVVALRDTPWLPEPAPDCLASQQTYDSCAVQAERVLDPENPMERMALPDNVHAVDLNDIVCFEARCSYVQGNRVVYRDDNHLTRSYVVSIAPVLEARLPRSDQRLS